MGCSGVRHTWAVPSLVPPLESCVCVRPKGSLPPLPEPRCPLLENRHKKIHRAAFLLRVQWECLASRWRMNSCHFGSVWCSNCNSSSSRQRPIIWAPRHLMEQLVHRPPKGVFMKAGSSPLPAIQRLDSSPGFGPSRWAAGTQPRFFSVSVKKGKSPFTDDIQQPPTKFHRLQTCPMNKRLSKFF